MITVQVLAALLTLLLALHVPRIAYALAALVSAPRGNSGGRPRARVTVVVPAKQEPLELIRGLLVNLAMQECRPYEVVILWDHPSTGYERVAREAWRLGDKLGLRVRVVAKPWRGRGKSSVLNLAVRLARGTHILVVDVDDRLCGPRVLCEIERLGARVAQLGLRGVAYLHPLQGPPAVAVHTGFRVVHHGRVSLGATPLLVGTGLFVERRLAARLLFDEEMIVEDVDFAVRLAAMGVKPALIPDALCAAGAPGYRAFRRQQSRWSMGAGMVLRRRWGILAGLGMRGAELAYMLLNYALDPLTNIAASIYALAAWAFSAPLWPLYAYTTVYVAELVLTGLIARTAPIARIVRNSATAGAMGAVLEPVLLVNLVRGLVSRNAVYAVTPRRVSGRERPGRLETIYSLLLGAAAAPIALTVPLAVLPLLLHTVSAAYLHVRLPRLSTSLSRRHPRAPSRRRASPR